MSRLAVGDYVRVSGRPSFVGTVNKLIGTLWCLVSLVSGGRDRAVLRSDCAPIPKDDGLGDIGINRDFEGAKYHGR